MVSKDFKKLLQHHASDLFMLHSALCALKYSPYHQPLLRYSRGLDSSSEFYWCKDQRTAPLEIVWATPYDAPSLQPPTDVQQRAVALLRELDSQRELVALYRCGHIEGDTFILNWLIPFPAEYKPDKGEGSGVYYTVKQDGTLGLAGVLRR